MIDRSIAAKEWKPICLSQGGPKLSHICFADDLILFAEASVAQVRVIRKILETFCVSSGQKVSLEKSKIFFSNNVSRDLERLISEESGIKSTKELGKYLGMPVLQKRINKETFGEVLARVSSRLAGWKGGSLSFAGRLTLTKSVLSSIPVHTMSVISLPKSVLEGLDKVSRSFLWGSSPEKRKQHLVAWEKVCKPKKEGGLGIRLSRDMNKALISKVGWRLIKDHTSLWARVLRSKYKVGGLQDRTWINAKRPSSSTWRSVIGGLKEVVTRGSRWVVGDGREVRFWTDKWLSNEPLLDSVVTDVPTDQMELRVKELWREGTGWIFNRITPYVSHSARLQLMAVVIDNITGARDRLSWGETADGEFTVKSAYALLTRNSDPRPDLSSFFDRVWRVVAPERVRTFLWLVGHQAIMTNVERHRRHLGDTSVCQVCKGGEETILHVLRDCPSIAGIWRRIVPASRRNQFWNTSILEWLYGNLQLAGNGVNESWATLFALGVWWGWKWRCGYIFGENGKCRDRVKFVKDLAAEVERADRLSRETRGTSPRVERMIAWKPPTGEWWKLNTDGASRGNPGLATAGGVLRDGAGHWRGGFSLNIGVCSAPLAELWGVYYGLYIAWERRCRRLELEVDSELVVGFLQTGINDSHPLSFLVRLCHGFISRDWIVRVSHVYREANRLADGLANYAFTLPLGFHAFDFAPPFVEAFVEDDDRGTAFPRHVRL
ncbi:Ribonuclease H domain [Arabidopsis thaliana x Arabidopsis arenosa]|uniref:Ribonuclease H domain n=1 Tax=Arabidopsis thaliana x Arabidopsis arenosa TaxID=1240361 RepID=A0A8T1XGD1_9BRAS|nr:Ribonuclease H domain [Arabidopsis thaliana x Arabidopsis arenosa]